MLYARMQLFSVQIFFVHSLNIMIISCVFLHKNTYVFWGF